MDPVPEDMAPYYKGGYDPIPANVTELKSISLPEKYRTEPLLKYKQKGRFLEIGPWRGVICSNMKDAGFDVTAIEMDARCVTFLREHLGIHAIQSTDPADTMRRLDAGFDVIVAWHSMEHLPTPWLVIREAARLLAPGGILMLAMPNPASYEFSVLKASWMHLDAPRHLFFYTIDALVHLCEENGLAPLEITTSDKFSNIQSGHAWRNWARSWIPIRYVRGVIGETVGKLLYWAAYKKQTTPGRGSAYTALFTRRERPLGRV